MPKDLPADQVLLKPSRRSYRLVDAERIDRFDRLDSKGREVLDPTPLAVSAGPLLHDRVRTMLSTGSLIPDPFNEFYDDEDFSDDSDIPGTEFGISPAEIDAMSNEERKYYGLEPRGGKKPPKATPTPGEDVGASQPAQDEPGAASEEEAD